MKSCEMKIVSPRGTFNIHTIYDNEKEANADGWGFWFQHENWLILGRDNRVGAVVEVSR
ncbi:hypothetical protein [Geobacter sp. SVR]|uniref:hypothetical protein n=1 Tax=Geobacter sp. SVR TaxID=2495594 RepID=UPI00143EFA78|nr:hypothetical protein [Geobacter sp. SVR]BCS53292.1 hypothetical protein GSVR_16000 [Geobacter sp. SVR]GCF85582.1 hypothetical protein GSbR_21820 [Geobacter sp. SVR]